MRKSIEEMLEEEAPEETEREKAEVLQELEIYFSKTAEGKRFWKKKGSRIKRYLMKSSAKLSSNNNHLPAQKNTPMRY